jgi:hypothetical protein
MDRLQEVRQAATSCAETPGQALPTGANIPKSKCYASLHPVCASRSKEETSLILLWAVVNARQSDTPEALVLRSPE